MLDFFAADDAFCEGGSFSWKGVVVERGGRRILGPVSGEAAAGSFLAILGGSGSGKTTLLRVLSSRCHAFQGRCSYVGKGKVGYVPQDDVLCEWQTVREAIRFSASLRLPSMAEEERADKVEAAIRTLSLSSCADTLIGGGISGGERKRAAIGVELVADPDSLVLDEPTSGLDSFSAFSLLSHLSSLAHSGCTVLATLHQPSCEVFVCIDDVVVLHSGKVAFRGAAREESRSTREP